MPNTPIEMIRAIHGDITHADHIHTPVRWIKLGDNVPMLDITWTSPECWGAPKGPPVQGCLFGNDLDSCKSTAYLETGATIRATLSESHPVMRIGDETMRQIRAYMVDEVES